MRLTCKPYPNYPPTKMNLLRKVLFFFRRRTPQPDTSESVHTNTVAVSTDTSTEHQQIGMFNGARGSIIIHGGTFIMLVDGMQLTSPLLWHQD